MQRLYILLGIIVLYCAADFYIFPTLRLIIADWSPQWKKIFTITYFSVVYAVIVGVFLSMMVLHDHGTLRNIFLTSFFALLVGKVIMVLFLAIDDFRRLVMWLYSFIPSEEPKIDNSRSKFMGKAAVVAGTIPLATMSFGIISGAHDYRVRKKTVYLKNLPKSFDGIRIGQLSDIHTGSFFNKTAVAGGVDLLNAEKPDIVFFTGDLVNEQSDEAKPYLDVFKKVKADRGVYSTMGNHDYGDYRDWSSPQAQQADIRQLHQMHKYMGWDILLNENRVIEESGDKFAILGLENWGGGRFSKYGNMEKTLEGLHEANFHLLLSHDPSHWDAQVLKEYPQIDLSLAGHTHGMQFGVEIGDFRWSPSKYIYPRWADLYQEGDQFLYVNRGYGFLGYPGRIGILPEITILELKSV